MNESTIQPLGPEGIQKRVSEIRARMSQVVGTRGQEFQMPDGPGAMQGAIGSASVAPLSPNGPGVSVDPTIAPEHLKAMIGNAAAQHGVEPALLDALVSVESGYDPSARSRAGALGLTQLMPGTALSLGVTNPMDPAQNLDGGAKYLSQMLKRFQDPKLALAAYNAGPGAVLRAGGVPDYAETRGYVNKVMALWEQKRAQ